MNSSFQPKWLLDILIISIIMALMLNNHIVPVRTRRLIVQRSLEGVSREQLAADYRLKPRTIDTYIARFNRTGDILTDYEIRKQSSPNGKVPRTKKLDDHQRADYLLREGYDNPSKSLYQHSFDFYGEFGVYVSPQTIDRFYKERKWKYKRLSPMARESNPTEVAFFWRCIEDIVPDPNCMIFVDESHRNDKTSNKAMGRGPPGYICT